LQILAALPMQIPRIKNFGPNGTKQHQIRPNRTDTTNRTDRTNRTGYVALAIGWVEWMHDWRLVQGSRFGSMFFYVMIDRARRVIKGGDGKKEERVAI
jgi:hypothetical protein